MDAHNYAELIDRILNSCEYLELRPGFQSKVQIPDDNPHSFWWKEKIFFRDRKILKVTDGAIFDPDGGGMIERKFAYDFRDCGSFQPLFRVCNHAEWYSINDPCHVHVNHDENRIKCFSYSKGRDFAYIIHCIKNFYEGKQQDWDKWSGDASAEQNSVLQH